MTACTICRAEPARPEWFICSGCAGSLDKLLADITRDFAALDATPGGGSKGRGSPGFRSSPAARPDVLLLRDPRTRITREDRWAGATVNVLADWIDEAEATPTDWTVAGLVDALRGQLDRIAARPWVDDLWRDLTDHHRELLRVSGLLEPSVAIGPCPVVVALDDDDEPIQCGGRIRARAWGTKATCGRCRSQWVGANDWRALGRALGPVELDAAELARYFGHSTPSTVRTWASRDHWPRRRSGGRTVYPLTAALATWARLNPPAEDVAS